MLRARAERCYTAHDYRGAYEVARRVRERDPYDFGCAPVYLASLVELGAKHELFSTAHELAKAYPQKACSWFAVGCYYLLVKKNDQAQRHFHKACKLAPRFAPAWIGFGNAFAAQDESEQAMAAYRTASRLFQGSHVPLAYIGMEYLRTNNLPLAKHFLRGAKKLCASDPLVANELGVVEMRQGLLDDACRTFQEVLRLLERLPERAPLRRACAASVFNLAQCYRKRRRFEDAARAFGVALSLEPGDAAARGALGVALHALGGAHVHRAVECYQVALAMRPDTFCSTESAPLRRRGAARRASRWPCGPTTWRSLASCSEHEPPARVVARRRAARRRQRGLRRRGAARRGARAGASGGRPRASHRLAAAAPRASPRRRGDELTPWPRRWRCFPPRAQFAAWSLWEPAYRTFAGGREDGEDTLIAVC